MPLRHPTRVHDGFQLPTVLRLVAASAALFALRAPALEAQQKPKAASAAVPAAMAAIREADLKRDLYAMAGDGMRGREAGTIDEMRASIWVAEQLRAIGVKPAGQDGSYFQWWNMLVTRVSTVSSCGEHWRQHAGAVEGHRAAGQRQRRRQRAHGVGR